MHVPLNKLTANIEIKEVTEDGKTGRTGAYLKRNRSGP